MAKYTFDLHSFTINERRTNHPFGGGSDTVKIAIALQVGDYKYPAIYKAAGDLGDTGKEYVQDHNEPPDLAAVAPGQRAHGRA